MPIQFYVVYDEINENGYSIKSRITYSLVRACEILEEVRLFCESEAKIVAASSRDIALDKFRTTH